MCLYDIPDIRLFWSTDPRFLGQFQPDRITTFVPFSKYPGTYKDISFWAGECGAVCDNDVFEVVRGVAGDLVESVELVGGEHLLWSLAVAPLPS